MFDLFQIFLLIFHSFSLICVSKLLVLLFQSLFVYDLSARKAFCLLFRCLQSSSVFDLLIIYYIHYFINQKSPFFKKCFYSILQHFRLYLFKNTRFTISENHYNFSSSFSAIVESLGFLLSVLLYIASNVKSCLLISKLYCGDLLVSSIRFYNPSWNVIFASDKWRFEQQVILWATRKLFKSKVDFDCMNECFCMYRNGLNFWTV